MELHAWVVAIPVGKWNGAGCRNLRKRNLKMLKRIGDEGFLNPEMPQTAGYIADICEEIVRNYDVDGIHLDYIRYPENWNIKVTPTLGRSFITRIVKAIHDRIKPIKPYVKLSSAPIGKHDDLTRYQSYGWNAYRRVCQDAQGWLRDGLMDQLFPMMYFQGRQFFPFAIDWSENSYGRIVTPGLGIYFLSPKEKDWPLEIISREMHVLRQYGLGHAFFRSKFFTDNTKGIYDFTLKHNASPALVPPMTWANSTAPAAPTCLALDRNHVLTWQKTVTGGDIYYNVYSSPSHPVDITDGRNLIAARVSGNAVKVGNSDRMYYAVTAMNRYGVESGALQMEPRGDLSFANPSAALSCDGRKLILPHSQEVWERNVVLLVTDVQGNPVLASAWKGQTLDVSKIAPGVYHLYVLTSRGVRHRCGYFVIRRYCDEWRG